MMFPLGEHIAVNLGDVPQWIAAFAAAYAAWKSSRAVIKIEQVRHETNSMRESLERARVLEGRKQVEDEIAAAAVKVKGK